MYIVRLGKKLLLSRLFEDSRTEGLYTLDKINYVIFGSKYNPVRATNPDTVSLVEPQFAVGLNTQINISDYLTGAGIQVTCSFREDKVPARLTNSVTLNEYGLCYIASTTDVIDMHPSQSPPGYTLFNYGKLRDVIVSYQQTGGATFTFTISIYAP